MAAFLLCWRLGADLLCKQLFHLCLCDAVVSMQHAQLHSQQTTQQQHTGGGGSVAAEYGEQHREGRSLLNTVKQQGQSPRSAHIKLKVCFREALGVDVCVFWQEELLHVLLLFLLHCLLLWASGFLLHRERWEMIETSLSRVGLVHRPTEHTRPGTSLLVWTVRSL